MNSENGKYTELIDRIKAAQVNLSNPQEFTSKVMQDIERLSKKENHSKMLYIISLTFSIAASLLIGLFVLEQFLLSNIEEHKNLNITEVYVLPVDNKNIHSEKSNVVNKFNTLINRNKERQKQQQAIYLKISKYKIL
jgi:hypothetical protein